MDNRIANDMISSGMIPSGEKKKEDLSRTQYGSAPSPNALLDAYKSMYDKKEEVINEHHKKDADGNTIPHEHEEELNEGKIPAGLQAYLDKKKGKKEDKKEMKEGAGLYANIHAKRKRGGKMRKKGDAGAPSSQDFANAAKTAKEEVEMKEGIGMAAKAALGVVKNIAKKQVVKDVARGAAAQFGAQTVGGMMNSGGGQQKPKTGTVSATQYASADLFDIVKGQLLDEGLSEEEIRDIMLTLTPDEIMKEMNQGPSTPVKNYGDSPDKPKILPNFGATRAKPRTTDKGTIIKGGKDTGKTPAQTQMSQEEYKNFDPKKPDPKQMAAQAKQEKNRQKFNDPMGVKNRNIGGQGLDPMDK